MQANLFTVKIRNVNPKCEAPRPSRQDGTGTAGPFDRSHGSELVEELPGHASGEQNVSKGNIVLMVPLNPVYPALAGRGTFRST
jgi:hypothetical protein